MNKLSVLGFLVVSVLGCAPIPMPATSDEVAQRTVVVNSRFDVAPTIQGPAIPFSVRRGLYTDTGTWRLGAIRRVPGAPVAVVLLIDISHADPHARLYRSMSFVGGERVELRRVSYEPHCTRLMCTHNEAYGGSLPPDKVQAADLPLRFNADNGMDIEITVPAHYIQGVLSKAR